MKKTTFQERIQQLLDEFFNNDDADMQRIAIRRDGKLVNPQKHRDTRERAEEVLKMLRGIFAYVPGAFFLFIAVMSSFVFGSSLGITAWGIFWFAAGTFLVWAGLGDLRKLRHLMLPALIIAFWMLVGITLSVLPADVYGRVFAEYAFVLFPVSLIIPVLAKRWIENE